jgi:hypothetical protein
MATLQLHNTETIYTIPQDLQLTLADTLDEHREVIRVSLGIVNPSKEDQEKFNILFSRLEEKSEKGFIDGFTITEGDTILNIELATIIKTEKPYGIFYDIEAAISAAHFSKRIDNESKGKKVKRKRKTTNKSKSK